MFDTNPSPLRRFGLAVAIAAFASAALPSDRAVCAEVEERSIESVPSSINVFLEVSNISGETLIEAWDQEEIQVEAVKVGKARNREQARRLLGEISFDIEGDRDHVRITARYPQRDSLGRSLLDALFSGTEGVWIDFVIRVPAEAGIAVSSTSGDVEVRNLAGPVQIDATSGNVLARDIDEDLEVECTSGDIEILRIGGDVRVHATSGEILIEEIGSHVTIGVTSGDVSGQQLRDGGEITTISGSVIFAHTGGPFEVSSSSGDVVFRRHRGTATIKTSSGDMELSLLGPLTGVYRLDASSGSVLVEVPIGSSCRLDISTSTGTLRARLPLEVEEISRNHLVAVAGRGAATFEITTATGDVEVVERDDL